MTIASALDTVTTIITKLEGEYKWYVLTGVIVLLGLFFSRIFFKTVKWLFWLILLGALIVGGFYFLSSSAGL